ncbi:MAG: hypothetical protein Q9226_005659 [Calogaya cf. arnoldii]
MTTITAIIEEEELPIALIPTVPRLKFHEAPLYFMSESGLTQQEYQAQVLMKGIPDDSDDTITVKCPDREDGTGRVFHFQRSTLKRSPTFAQFFESRYYLHGCKMMLTFLLDPAVCIETAYKYLEEGPDVFQQTILRVQLTMRYKLVDRSMILIKLYSLARKLALPLLADMAFNVLAEGDHQMTVSNCVTLSSLIFEKRGVFDRKLKEWCICRIRSFVPELRQSTFWQEVLWNMDTELEQRWYYLLEEEIPSRLDADDEAAEDQGLLSAPNQSPSGNPSPRSTSTIKSKEEAFQEILEDIRLHEEAFDREWDTTEALAASSRSHGTTSKVVRLLGPLESSPPVGLKREDNWPKGMSPSPSMLFSPGLDKARYVMGYPGSEETSGRYSMTGSTPVTSPTKSARRLRFWATSTSRPTAELRSSL